MDRESILACRGTGLCTPWRGQTLPGFPGWEEDLLSLLSPCSGVWAAAGWGHLGRYLVLKCQKSQELHMFLLVTFWSQVGP